MFVISLIQINDTHSVHLARKMVTVFSLVEVIAARVWQDSEEFSPPAVSCRGKPKICPRAFTALPNRSREILTAIG